MARAFGERGGQRQHEGRDGDCLRGSPGIAKRIAARGRGMHYLSSNRNLWEQVCNWQFAQASLPPWHGVGPNAEPNKMDRPAPDFNMEKIVNSYNNCPSFQLTIVS